MGFIASSFRIRLVRDTHFVGFELFFGVSGQAVVFSYLELAAFAVVRVGSWVRLCICTIPGTIATDFIIVLHRRNFCLRFLFTSFLEVVDTLP